jgi:hypothetical protein
MDAYYQNQINIPYYAGAARQRGSGLGSFALSVGRAVLPIFRKIVLPTLASVGKNLLKDAVPELGDVFAGRQSIKNAAKKSVKKTLSRQLGSGRKPKLGSKSSSKVPLTKRKRSKSVRKQAKRSRLDLMLDNLKE